MVANVGLGGYNGTFQVYSSNNTSVQYTVGNPGGTSSGGTLVQESVTTYDGDGNQATQRDSRGNVTTTTYDFDEQQLSQSIPNSSNPASSQTYDAVGTRRRQPTTVRPPMSQTMRMIR